MNKNYNVGKCQNNSDSYEDYNYYYVPTRRVEYFIFINVKKIIFNIII